MAAFGCHNNFFNFFVHAKDHFRIANIWKFISKSKSPLRHHESNGKGQILTPWGSETWTDFDQTWNI